MFLITLYGPPLAQRASLLALYSSFFGPDGTVNYDYIVTNSINSLLIGSDVFPIAHILMSWFGPCFKIYQKRYHFLPLITTVAENFCAVYRILVFTCSIISSFSDSSTSNAFLTKNKNSKKMIN